MQEYVTTVTQRGQVTIPVQVRRLIGAKPRGKVAFRVEGNDVTLVAAEHTLESAFGSVPPLSQPEDFKRLERAAKDERAARTVRKLRRR